MQIELKFICFFLLSYLDIDPDLSRNHSGQLSSDDDGTDSNRQESVTEAMSASQCLSQLYRKSLRLTSQQIVNNIVSLQT